MFPLRSNDVDQPQAKWTNDHISDILLFLSWVFMGWEEKRLQTKNADDLKTLIKAAWASFTSAEEPADGLLIHAKGGKAKYWQQINEHSL